MKKVVEMNGRTFECDYSPELSGEMCAVAIYEVVRPSWKIFRVRYCKYVTFWVTDYETLTEGITNMVKLYLDEEEHQNEISKIWSE